MSENSIEFSLSNSEQRDSWLNSGHWTLDADIDPQYLQHIENLCQSYIAIIKETFKSQLNMKRLGWSKQQQKSTS